jgi:heme exporter protein B
VNPVAAIIFKDIAIEYKNKEAFSSMLLFGLLIVVVFSFAFEGQDRKAVAPGMLWVASRSPDSRPESLAQYGMLLFRACSP